MLITMATTIFMEISLVIPIYKPAGKPVAVNFHQLYP